MHELQTGTICARHLPQIWRIYVFHVKESKMALILTWNEDVRE